MGGFSWLCSGETVTSQLFQIVMQPCARQWWKLLLHCCSHIQLVKINIPVKAISMLLHVRALVNTVHDYRLACHLYFFFLIRLIASKPTKLCQMSGGYYKLAIVLFFFFPASANALIKRTAGKPGFVHSHTSWNSNAETWGIGTLWV